jgi:5-methylcytosine-specific restriction endonuclease McrA
MQDDKNVIVADRNPTTGLLEAGFSVCLHDGPAAEILYNRQLDGEWFPMDVIVSSVFMHDGIWVMPSLNVRKLALNTDILRAPKSNFSNDGHWSTWMQKQGHGPPSADTRQQQAFPGTCQNVLPVKTLSAIMLRGELGRGMRDLWVAFLGRIEDPGIRKWLVDEETYNEQCLPRRPDVVHGTVPDLRRHCKRGRSPTAPPTCTDDSRRQYYGAAATPQEETVRTSTPTNAPDRGNSGFMDTLALLPTLGLSNADTMHVLLTLSREREETARQVHHQHEETRRHADSQREETAREQIRQRGLNRRYCAKRRQFPPGIRVEIVANQSGRCNLCEVRLDRICEVDHIKPLHLGGEHQMENAQALCRQCHGNKTWRENARRFGQQMFASVHPGTDVGENTVN